MNVILFHTSTCRLYPIAQTSVCEDRPVTVPTGFWGRLKQKLRTGYEAIEERLNHEERFCSCLRHATHLRVLHPTSETSEEAEKRFRQFLRLGYSKHSRWFWIDAVLAFLGMFLMFLPGPNIFFFYPAIRSFGHYQARNGARNGLSLADTVFTSEPLMDEIQAHLDNLQPVLCAVEQVASKYQIANLEKSLLQLGEK